MNVPQAFDMNALLQPQPGAPQGFAPNAGAVAIPQHLAYPQAPAQFAPQAPQGLPYPQQNNLGIVGAPVAGTGGFPQQLPNAQAPQQFAPPAFTQQGYAPAPQYAPQPTQGAYAPQQAAQMLMGLESAAARVNAEYFQVGKYLCALESMAIKNVSIKGAQANAFITEWVVIQSTNPAVAIGSRLSDFERIGTNYTFPKIRNIIASLEGLAEGRDAARIQQEIMPNAINKALEGMTGKYNGRQVIVEGKPKETKGQNGQPPGLITVTYFSPLQ